MFVSQMNDCIFTLNCANQRPQECVSYIQSDWNAIQASKSSGGSLTWGDASVRACVRVFCFMSFVINSCLFVLSSLVLYIHSTSFITAFIALERALTVSVRARTRLFCFVCFFLCVCGM
jgi:hypothetical protein